MPGAYVLKLHSQTLHLALNVNTASSAVFKDHCAVQRSPGRKPQLRTEEQALEAAFPCPHSPVPKPTTVTKRRAQESGAA